MLSIDQFESAFRAAAKTHFHPVPVSVQRVLVITDLEATAAQQYAERAAPFLDSFGETTITAVTHAQSADLSALLALIHRIGPQLIISYRCLHSPAWQLPYTIGDHIEVLTQVTDVPVLLLPRIDTGHADAEPLLLPHTVMAMTDHLVGDDRLVSWAADLCQERLVLAHVEDDVAFERTMGLIGKIPEIDTDLARRKLSEMMITEASDWIDSCRNALSDKQEVISAVMMGHRLETYRSLVSANNVDLLVLNTKDDDQMAIHGMAWPLMIELRHIPLLLL